MKNVIFSFIMAILFLPNLYAQTIHEVSPGLLGYRYEYGGKIIGGAKLKKIIHANPDAHDYLIKSRLHNVVGIPMMAASTIVLTSSFVNSALGHSSVPLTSEQKARRKRDTMIQVGTGIGLMTISIVLFKRGNRFRKKAISTYNKDLSQHSFPTKLMLNVDNQQFGVVWVF